MDRLFVYGSLAPGRPNAHVLEKVPGSWEPAVARGWLKQSGWGAAMGFPGIVPDPEGDEVPGFVFSSEEMSAQWAMLDDFEGEGYQRVLTKVTLSDGRNEEAFVYALRGA